MPTTTPTQAISVFWDAHPEISTLFPGGTYYSGEAPDEVTTMPYAVLLEVSSTTMDLTTANRLINHVYQFTCMADNLVQAESLALAIAVAFDRATLTMSGGDILHCLATDTHWMLGVGLGIGGQDCWVCYTELELLVAR